MAVNGSAAQRRKNTRSFLLVVPNPGHSPSTPSTSAAQTPPRPVSSRVGRPLSPSSVAARKAETGTADKHIVVHRRPSAWDQQDQNGTEPFVSGELIAAQNNSGTNKGARIRPVRLQRIAYDPQSVDKLQPAETLVHRYINTRLVGITVCQQHLTQKLALFVALPAGAPIVG